jgi:hypothetical protein
MSTFIMLFTLVSPKEVLPLALPGGNSLSSCEVVKTNFVRMINTTGGLLKEDKYDVRCLEVIIK